MRAAVGTPIVVEGRLWGAMVAASTQDESLPADTELRIGEFTELMATAIANAESQARWRAWPTSRRRSGAWRRWSPRAPGPPRSSTP